MRFRTIFGLFVTTFVTFSVSGQQYLTGSDTSNRVITTAVPFLSITPDARHAALGDAGVASSPDANSSYWNAATLVFIDRQGGGSLSYTPWLGKIINDMWIGQLSGFYKIGNEQAVAAGLKYFDLGDIFLTTDGNTGTNFNPKEFAFDVTYSRLLTDNLSVGLTGRYIHSNLTGSFSGGGVEAQPGNSAAFDMGVFYTSKALKGNSNLSLGAAISNVGAKISYSDNNNKDFLPTNLRVGGAYTTSLDVSNTITFLLDFNKLLVPSPPVYDIVNGQIQYDSNGNPIIKAGRDPDRSLLSGIFGSFSDAPDGFKEEIKEIQTSLGIEYWYLSNFAGRIGYFLESTDKGNRKYLTFGCGYSKEQFSIDLAYLVPTNKRDHPLAETIRVTLSIHAPKLTGREPEESVTD